MTEENKINYEEFAKEYIQGMKDANETLLTELPLKLESADDKKAGLGKLLEAIEAESDEFKTDNEKLIAALKATYDMIVGSEEQDEADTSEAATEGSVDTVSDSDVKEAVEPEAAEKGQE